MNYNFTYLFFLLFYRLRDTYASNYFADRNYANLDKSEYVDNLSGVADARSGDYLKSFYFQVFISMITYVDFNAVSFLT